MGDNVTIKYSTNSSYELVYNPKMRVSFEEVKITHNLADGLEKYYHLGYKIHVNLYWSGSNFFRTADYDGLRAIYNLHDGITFCPAPTSYPNAEYGVRWTNYFNFSLVNGVTPYGYTGSISLVGTSILSSIDANFSAGEIA